MTRPRASADTPYHSSSAGVSSQPVEFVQSGPPELSYSRLSTPTSDSLQYGPEVSSMPSSQATKSIVPGAHRSAFLPKRNRSNAWSARKFSGI